MIVFECDARERNQLLAQFGERTNEARDANGTLWRIGDIVMHASGKKGEVRALELEKGVIYLRVEPLDGDSPLIWLGFECVLVSAAPKSR